MDVQGSRRSGISLVCAGPGCEKCFRSVLTLLNEEKRKAAVSGQCVDLTAELGMLRAGARLVFPPGCYVRSPPADLGTVTALSSR